MGLKIQANGPQKAQPNAILEKVFTAITKVCYLTIVNAVLQWICASYNVWGPSLVLSAPRWKEAGGPFQAARLGCSNHPALVPTTAQPGETQHPGPILWKHVRRLWTPQHIILYSKLFPQHALLMKAEPTLNSPVNNECHICFHCCQVNTLQYHSGVTRPWQQQA